MKSSEKKLLALYKQLESTDQETLLAFAKFLSVRDGGDNPSVMPVAKPQIIHRPESESVVAAIKRLTSSYPMLDKPQLLNESSAIMTRHVMQGMEAKGAIDELEVLFLQFYEELTEDSGRES